MNIEYVYIRTTESATAIHFGTTKDYKKRYKTSADEIQDSNKYLYVFECNENTGHQIESDFKNKFREYLHEREIYLWNDVLKEKYLHYIRTHKEIIGEVDLDYYYKDDKKVIKKIVKIKSNSRNLKEMGLTMQDIQVKARKSAKQIQKDNDITKYTSHDEFYTRYEDVEKVVSKFSKEFEDKVVFCNCDDVLDNDDNKCSAFALYFKKNFKRLKLKKLICTHFIGITNLFNQNPIGYIYVYNGDVIEIKNEKGYDGSFYHPESVRILNEEADICCTNHPWSLTEKFYEILFASKKKFLVISNINIILWPYFFDKIKNKELLPIKRIDNFYNKNKTQVSASGCWFTNFKYKYEKYKKLIPLKDIPDKYKQFDDKGILNIGGGFIPSDYENPFAVSHRPILNGILENGFEIIDKYYPYIKGKSKWIRLLIQKTGSVK